MQHLHAGVAGTAAPNRRFRHISHVDSNPATTSPQICWACRSAIRRLHSPRSKYCTASSQVWSSARISLTKSRTALSRRDAAALTCRDSWVMSQTDCRMCARSAVHAARPWSAWRGLGGFDAEVEGLTVWDEGNNDDDDDDDDDDALVAADGQDRASCRCNVADSCSIPLTRLSISSTVKVKALARSKECAVVNNSLVLVVRWLATLEYAVTSRLTPLSMAV